MQQFILRIECLLLLGPVLLPSSTPLIVTLCCQRLVAQMPHAWPLQNQLEHGLSKIWAQLKHALGMYMRMFPETLWMSMALNGLRRRPLIQTTARDERPSCRG